MAFELRIEDPVLRALNRIDPAVRQRILKKLAWFARLDTPLSFATRLTDPKLGTHRFRIGDWRVIVDVDTDRHRIRVLEIGHRREIYR
jgi:mRNA interferase RelE/StbE